MAKQIQQSETATYKLSSPNDVLRIYNMKHARNISFHCEVVKQGHTTAPRLANNISRLSYRT